MFITESEQTAMTPIARIGADAQQRRFYFNRSRDALFYRIKRQAIILLARRYPLFVWGSCGRLPLGIQARRPRRQTSQPWSLDSLDQTSPYDAASRDGGHSEYSGLVRVWSRTCRIRRGTLVSRFHVRPATSWNFFAVPWYLTRSFDFEAVLLGKMLPLRFVSLGFGTILQHNGNF